MKRSLSLLLFALCSLLMTKAASATTWYVRADGGGRFTPTRQSWGFPAQQIGCDGQADAPYPGSGVNQHCAFNDVRFLWDSQTDYGTTAWIIAGGDTVILDNTKAWRVGYDQGLSPNDKWCWGGQGPNACGNPNIPAGTAQQHTRILGRNFASCSTAASQPDPTKMTELFGGFGVWDALNLNGAQNVDVECLNITRHSQCVTHGSPALPSGCSNSFPMDDFDSDGIGTDINTHDVLLQDLWIHGHTDRGIKGAIGGLITANRVNIDTNGMAGWDLDPGDSTQSPNGSIVAHYMTIQFSGCNQEYPFVDSVPVTSCYSQSTGGYGDGIGTPVTYFGAVSIDHSVFRYNTQDGEDFGHVYGAPSLTITDSVSYGNSGGQFKWAGFQNVNFANNVAIGNCLRMSQPLAGAPAGYNAHLGDFCRAFDALSFDFNNNANLQISNNTIVSYAPTTFDVQCYDSASCAGSTLTMTNNIVLGYANPTTLNMGGQSGGPSGFCGATCNSSTLPVGTFNRVNNVFYGLRGSCIANNGGVLSSLHNSAIGESCLDPKLNNEPASFASEATLDGFDFSLTSNSPAKFAGVNLAGLTTDLLGAARNNPPSLGALEYASAATLNTFLNWTGTVVSSATSSTTATTTTSTSGTSTSTTGTSTSTGTSTTTTSAPPTTTTSSSGTSTTTTTSSSGTSTTTTSAPPTTTTSTTSAPPTTTTSTSSSGTSTTTTTSSKPKAPSATKTVLSEAKGPNAANPAILTATVTSTGKVTGTVIIFTSSNWPIAVGNLNANGQVSWTVPAALKNDTVYAVYSGNTSYLKSTSASLNGATTVALLTP